MIALCRADVVHEHADFEIVGDRVETLEEIG